MALTDQDDRERILVIDDNRGFLASAQRALARLFVVETIHASDELDPSSVIDQVRRFRPDHLLLDIDLRGSSQTSQGLLAALVDAGALEGCRTVRLISFGLGLAAPGRRQPGTARADAEAEVIARYQKISGRVADRIIRKPIDPFDLLAELTEAPVFNPPESWRHFPLPIRVLARTEIKAETGEVDRLAPVVWANPAWTALGASVQKPAPAGPHFQPWRDQAQVPAVLDQVGNPFDTESDRYRLHSFAIRQDDQDFLGQVVESRALGSIEGDLDQTLDAIFKAMAQAGFTAGQCYLIEPLMVAGEHPVEYQPLDPSKPDAESVSEVAILYRLSDNHPVDLRKVLPLRRPLRGVLRQRAERVLADLQKAGAKKLIYRIHTAAKDTQSKNDDDVRWWSNEFNTRLSTSWNHEADSLVIPVAAARTDPITGSEDVPLRIAAVLSFSRAANGTTDPDRSMQDIDSSITEADVAPVKPLLVGLVGSLRRALFRDRQQQFIRMQSDILEMDRKIHGQKDPDQKKQRVLDALLKATDADHLILLTQGSGAFLMPDGVANREGVEPVPAYGQKVETPLHDQTFGVVQVWNQRCAMFLHNGADSPHVEAVVERYGKSPREDEKQWAKWSEEYVGSAITYPITVDDRTIALFILYFRAAWRTTQSLIWAIESVVHRCRWVVQSIIAERDRSSWLQALGHELRRDLYTANNALAELQRTETLHVASDDASEKRWRRFRRNFVNATTLADNWLDMMRGVGREEPGPAFAALEALDAYIELNKDYHADLAIAWHHEPARSESVWQTDLIYHAWFERVIRVLLDNAGKFGRLWIDAHHDEAHAVNLHLSARLLDGQSRFELRISNPGHMSPIQHQYRYDSDVPRAARSGDGAHVGLHAARKLVHAVGGELSLENRENGAGESTDEPVVEACLIWPRANNKEQCQ